MKIIQEGDQYIDKTWEIQCTGEGWNQHGKVPCGSILEVNVYDLMRYAGQDYPISRPPTIWFKCIKCECRTDISHAHDIWQSHQFDSRIKSGDAAV